MNTSRLVHPRMLQTLKQDFFPQRATLKKPVKSQNSTGEQRITFTDQYRNVPCRVGAASGGERRTNDFTYLDATHRIVLSGQFTDLTQEWQIVVDSVAYNILLSTPDPEQAMTRLEVELIQ